jgi:putative peptidoglycan lipid II flippase
VGLGLGFVIGPYIGLTPIYGMAWGVVFGGALQLVWQLPALRRSGFYFRPRFDWSDPGLVRILRLMGPAIIGNAAVQVNVMVNTNFASQIYDPVRGPDGPVSWLGYAFRFMQLPIGIFGVAIAAATLPSISRSIAHEDMDDFRRTLSRSVAMVFLLTVPSAIGLVVLRESIIGAIYQIGRFQQYDTEQTGLALACYAIGLAGYAATKVVNPAFYALNDSRTPMLVSLTSIAINFGMASTLIHGFGMRHYGLALSTSTVAIFSALTLFWVMRNRVRGMHGRDLLRSTLKIVAASLAMGVVVLATSSGIIGALGPNKLGRLADIAVSIPVGLLVYYAVCRALRVPELQIAAQALAGPLGRRFRRG